MLSRVPLRHFAAGMGKRRMRDYTTLA